MALGLVLALLWPGTASPITRGLIGWNVAVWLYLALVGWMMVHADHHLVRSVAEAQAESTATVLAIVSTACVVSLVAVVAELSAARLPGAPRAGPHMLFALVTVAGSWLLLPTVFALTYASRYYSGAHSVHHGTGHKVGPGTGLRFPDANTDLQPDYVDFLYVSFTMAVAAQTADVCVTSSPMRRLVLLQALLSFAFNTAILAFTINIAASMF
jgi:uncharacterized membrane protein